jgi:[ribosomal protein S18]-alanine N-acetyltransferase
MGEKLRIEPMRDEDVRSVAHLDASTPVDEGQLREELARPWSRLWIARDHRGVVAFLAAWHVADELHVLNVTTRPDRRRRGIARELMKTAIRYGQENRVRHLLLEVRRSNAGAMALYRAVGFFATGVRPRYYPDDEDAVEMRLLFDPVTSEIVAHGDEIPLGRARH